MNFFSNCKNQQEAKAKYRELCKEHHPDRGGKTETMTQINKQYDAFTPHVDTFSRMNDHFNQSYAQARQYYQGFGSFAFRGNSTTRMDGTSYADDWPKQRIDPNSFHQPRQETKVHQNIPFDHPIQQRIRDLEEYVRLLKIDRVTAQNNSDHWKSEYERKNHSNQMKFKENQELKEMLKEAKEEIEELKKKPLTLWQKILGVIYAK